MKVYLNRKRLDEACKMNKKRREATLFIQQVWKLRMADKLFKLKQ